MDKERELKMDRFLEAWNAVAAGSGGKYIQALVLLLVGWGVAWLISTLVVRALGLTALTNKMADRLDLGSGRAGSFQAGVGKITFWVLMLIVLVTVLDTLGLRSVIEPLNQLISKILDFIPNMLASGVLLFVAIIASRIVYALLSSLFGTLNLDSKIGLSHVTGSSTSLSQVLTTTASSFVFLLLLPASLQALNLKNVSAPIEKLIDSVVASFPHILVAIAILAIGVFLGKIIQGLVTDVLKVGGVDQLPEKVGLKDFANFGGKSLSEIIGILTFVSIFVLMFTQAVSALNLEFLSGISANFASGFFSVLGAVIIFVVGAVLAKSAKSALSGQKLAAEIVYYGIFILAGTMALDKANLAPQITSLSFQILIGAFAVALGVGGALALGLGGKDAVKRYLDRTVK